MSCSYPANILMNPMCYCAKLWCRLWTCKACLLSQIDVGSEVRLDRGTVIDDGITFYCEVNLASEVKENKLCSPVTPVRRSTN